MKLLVSVRSAEEAVAALAGGADLIDIKEPANGALGRASPETIAAIVQAVQQQALLSMALGELNAFRSGDWPAAIAAFCKLGLSGCAGSDWQQLLAARMREAPIPLVPTWYADSDRAECPALADTVRLACDLRPTVLLIDTFTKDGHGLFAWQSVNSLRAVREQLTACGIDLALAGSLGIADIDKVQEIAPAWFAVRGAACDEARREGTVRESRVRQIKAAIQ